MADANNDPTADFGDLDTSAQNSGTASPGGAGSDAMDNVNSGPDGYSGSSDDSFDATLASYANPLGGNLLLNGGGLSGGGLSSGPAGDGLSSTGLNSGAPNNTGLGSAGLNSGIPGNSGLNGSIPTATASDASLEPPGNVEGLLRDPYLRLLDFAGQRRLVAGVMGDPSIAQPLQPPPVPFHFSADSKRQYLGPNSQGLSDDAIHEIYRLKYGSVPEDDDSHIVNALIDRAYWPGADPFGTRYLLGGKPTPAVGTVGSQQNPGAVLSDDTGQTINFNGDEQNAGNPLLQNVAQRKRPSTGSNRPGAQRANTGDNSQQPISTVWKIDSEGNAALLPRDKSTPAGKQYKLAIPMVGPSGDLQYASEDQLQDYISRGYQPGRRAIMLDESGKVRLDGNHRPMSEIAVPFGEAENQAHNWKLRLLPISNEELPLITKANQLWRQHRMSAQDASATSKMFKDVINSSGGPTAPLQTPQWQPDNSDLARLMVPGATKDAVDHNLPAVMKALQDVGLSDPDMVRYALATINAETQPKFVPADELVSYGPYGNTSHKGARPFDLYEHKHGNSQPGDGERYNGRGYIQIMGRGDYKKWGKRLNLPLEEHPELVNQPQVAAKILAGYLKDHESSIRALLHAVDSNGSQNAMNIYHRYLQDPSTGKTELWNDNFVRARKIVNAAANGLDQFLPSFDFGLKHEEIRTAIQDPAKTLRDAASIWTKGYDLPGDSMAAKNLRELKAQYSRTLQKNLRVPMNTKLSALPAPLIRKMELAQIEFARRANIEINNLARLPRKK